MLTFSFDIFKEQVKEWQNQGLKVAGVCESSHMYDGYMPTYRDRLQTARESADKVIYIFHDHYEKMVDKIVGLHSYWDSPKKVIKNRLNDDVDMVFYQTAAEVKDYSYWKQWCIDNFKKLPFKVDKDDPNYTILVNGTPLYLSYSLDVIVPCPFWTMHIIYIKELCKLVNMKLVLAPPQSEEAIRKYEEWKNVDKANWVADVASHGGSKR